LRNRGRLGRLRYNQEYLERLRQDRDRRVFAPSFYFYTAPRYRYFRSGRYYVINNFAADNLRQAVELGYQEGFRAGVADRQDRVGFGYTDEFAFQDATYGYAGYLDLPEYQYYFRQGFFRGYNDGFYGRYQYGVYSNGVASIIGSVLNLIFNPRPY